MSLVRAERALIAGSILWLAVLPRIHGTQAAFVATACIVAVNAIFSLHILTQTRKILIALNLVQIVLFGVLSSQLAGAFGHEHYHFDREPRHVDWIEFTIAHVLRAADVLDALEEYGLQVQTISHRSVGAGIILVCMHLTVDAFLINLLLRWASRQWRDAPSETRLERDRREFAWLLASAGLFVGLGVVLQFRPIDWLLWPLDQLLRLLDVGDLMNVFGWRLHGVAVNGWTSTAGLIFRIAAGIWVARIVILWRLTVMRTWGLSIDELTKLLDDPDAQVRRGACIGLGQSGADAHQAVPSLVEALRDIDGAVRLEATRALGRIGSAAHTAVPRLVEALWLCDLNLCRASAQALGQIGTEARSAVHSLVYLLKVTDETTRPIVVQALQAISPEVLEALRLELEDMRSREVSPSKRLAAWQRCVEAARARTAREQSVRVQLLTLINDGFFNQERDMTALHTAITGLTEGFDGGIVAIPLLDLTAEGKLARRKTPTGRWVYFVPAPVCSCAVRQD